MKTKKLIPSIVFCIGLLFTSNTFATQEINQTTIDNNISSVNDINILQISDKFDSEDICNSTKKEALDNPNYTSYTRSDCFKITDINKYAYYLCGKEYTGDVCKTGGIINSGYEIDDSKKEVLDALLDVFASAKDTEKYKNDINGYKSFLDNYISKFTEIKSTKTQKDVIAMNDYIIEGLKTIRQEAENSEADDFLNSIKKMTNDLKNDNGNTTGTNTTGTNTTGTNTTGTNTTGTNIPGITTTRLGGVTVTSGKCSQVKEAQTLSSNPALCVESTISDFTSTSTGWSWKCIGNATAGSGQGPVDNCSATKKAELVNSEPITPDYKIFTSTPSADIFNGATLIGYFSTAGGTSRGGKIIISGDGFIAGDNLKNISDKILKGKSITVRYESINNGEFLFESWSGSILSIDPNKKNQNPVTLIVPDDYNFLNIHAIVKKQTNQEPQKDCGNTFNGFTSQTALKNLETGEFTKNISGGYQSIVLTCTNGELNYYPNGKDNTSTNCTEEGFEKNSAGTKCLEVVDFYEE